MSYDYGSQSLGIANPFRFEGALIALRGALLGLTGLYSLLQVAGLVNRGRELEGWISAGLGLLLLVWGLVALGQGLFKLFRFYVGRSVPATFKAGNHGLPVRQLSAAAHCPGPSTSLTPPCASSASRRCNCTVASA